MILNKLTNYLSIYLSGNAYYTTLDARDFSCAVSGFGQVLQVTRAKSLQRHFGLRPTPGESSSSRARKTSGIQGINTHTKSRTAHPRYKFPGIPPGEKS